MKHPALSFAAALLISAMVPAAAQTSRPAASAKPAEADARVIQIATGQGQPVSQHLTLGLNKAAIIELDSDAKDVLVSSPDIADAIVKSPRRIFLLGTKTGQTNAFFFDGRGHQVLSLDIRVEKDVADLAAMIKAALPNSSIKVAALNDNVVLSGRVASAS